MKKVYLSLVATTLLYGIDNPAPAPETPGIQLQKLQEVDNALKTIKKPAIVDKLKVDKNLEGKGKSNIKAPSFLLRNVSIKGNTVLDKNDIIKIVKPYIGKAVTSQDLKDIAAKITKLYKIRGYVTSECIIPAQKVQNGTVKFQIKEDRLGRIIIKGKTTYNYDKSIFMRYLQALQGKVINAYELNKQLKYLTNLPVTRVKPSLEKAKGNYTNLILNIEEGKEKFSIMWDNSGSAYTGKDRFTINGNINNIRGKSDSLNLSLVTVKDPKFLSSLSASYITPVGKVGGKVVFGYSYMYYQLDPDEVGTDTVIYEGGSNKYSLKYMAPLYLFRNINLSYSYGFEKSSVVAQTIENATGELLVDGRDDLFVLDGSVSIAKADRFFKNYSGVNSLSFTVKKALEGFLNSMTQEDLDRKEDDTTFPISGPVKYGPRLNPAFIKYYGTAKREQKLPWKVKMNINFSANYTKDRVPDSYEYSGGDFGYSYSMSFSRKFWKVNSSISVSQSKVYTNEIDGSRSHIENDPSAGISLSMTYKKLYMSASYSSSLDSWDSNTDNIRYKVKYTW